MRLSLVGALLAGLALSACNGDDATKPTGPVTLQFRTEVLAGDTVRGIAIVDGQDTVQIPNGSLANVSRGEHTIETHLDIDYLPGVRTVRVDPNDTVAVIDILQEGSCRDYAAGDDAAFCVGRNAIAVPGQTPRVFCPANDFGDVCSFIPDGFQLGLTWPADSAVTAANEYVRHARLLLGGVLGTNSPPAAVGDTVATALYDFGDYLPRRRLRPIGDSSRFQVEFWTDGRHVPFYFSAADRRSVLGPTDRVAANLGLGVTATYMLSPTFRNAIFVRYDVRNITAEPDYRRVHPEEPITGHTLTDVYITPMLDPAIGFNRLQAQAEGADDNVTVFPAESLVVAYDQSFSVSNFQGGYASRPGLVGLQVISGPPGTTAKAVLLTSATPLRFTTNAVEDVTYQVIAAGRAGNVSGCTSTAEALICSPETAADVRAGWSIGPVASLAPGESASVTVAILLAPPQTGTFTSGVSVAPENADLANTSRAIYDIAQQLRALAAQTKAVTVSPTR